MPLEGEAKREYNKRYREEKGKAARKERILKEYLNGLLDILSLEEKAEGRYKSEVLDRVALGKLFAGQPYKDTSEQDTRGTKYDAVEPMSESFLGVKFSEFNDVPSMKERFSLWLDYRDKARKDLFWLGTAVLRNDFISTTHQEVCDQFVQKNFDGCFNGDYTLGDIHRAIDKQLRFDESGQPTKEMMLLTPRGSYKALDVDTLIPTPDGFVKMLDVKEGDTVFDELGNPALVVGTSPIYYDRSCYEVIFSTGDSIICDAEHLWVTDSRRDRDNFKKPHPIIRTTIDIANSLLCGKERNHRISVARSIKTKQKQLLISPYVLGIWLGDGTAQNSNITCADDQIIEEIKKEGQVIRRNEKGRYLYVCNGGRDDIFYRKRSNNLASNLRQLGLHNNKHIPSCYLWSSFEQRLSLLQGLMDSDGHASIQGGCTFSNTNFHLISQVRTLIASLGFRPSRIRSYKARLKDLDVGIYYTMGFTAYSDGPIPFRLTRKISRLKVKTKVSLQNYRQIIEVSKVPSRPVKCIAVASPSHQYLAGKSFIPTHNSYINGVDCIQWMINVPDIRILILTGEYKLAVAFMRQIKSYLYMAKGQEPTTFHLLFPEYILRGVDGTSKEPLTLECRKINQKEPTLWVNSIDSNLSGWHSDLKKGDDVVTDENSNTPEIRESLKDKYDGTDNLLDEWGFSDHIGTRYFGGRSPDWYGSRLEIADQSPIKYFCRTCWTVKPEYQDVKLKELTADMVNLWFPEKLTFASLRKKLLQNERSFLGQQLNNPVGDEESGYKVVFTEESLRAHTYPATSAPKTGDLFICWDWALSHNKYSDFSVGVAGRVYQKEDKQYAISVLEVLFGRWKPSELAFHIVNFNKKWNPKKTLIERSSGAELLQMEIQRQAYKYATILDVYWKPPSLEENAKRNRIKGLELLLSDDRLWLVSGPWIDETYHQMVRYTGEKKNRSRKDDIPDAMSYLNFFLPRAVPVNEKQAEEMKALIDAQEAEARLRQQYERIFGSAPIQSQQLDDSLPPQTDTRRGILQKIFGNNGLRA